MRSNKKYDIDSEDPRTFTRLKPEVYCGDTTYPNQTVIEFFSNIIDEHVIKNGFQCWIRCLKNGFIYIKDEGQGIPVDEWYTKAKAEDLKKIQAGEITDYIEENGKVYVKSNKTTLERSFSVLNSSGKYDESGVYNGTSLGAYGIGSKLGTYLSNKLIVKSTRDGKFEELTFIEGILEGRKVGEAEDSSSGVEILYKPSIEFFGNEYIDENSLLCLIRDTCCLCPNFTVHYSNEITNTELDINCPRGIEELLDPLKDREIIKNRINIRYDSEETKQKLQMSITYTKDYTSSVVPYVNYGLTESGNHISAVKECITRTFNKFARDKMLLKEGEKNLTGDQIQEGMVCVFNLISPNIKYDAQVKSRVTSRDLSPFINEAMTNTLEYWLKQNDKEARKIIDKALLARKALEEARKAREKVRQEQTKQKIATPKVDKLSDCISKNPDDCEIYIVEGDSAGGSAKVGRDRKTQAILPLRGKILNVEKASESKIDANAEIKTMITAFGCGIGEDFDESRLKYHKIIIMSDADVDGAHISTLLLTFFYRFMPNLIKNGYVYCAVPPLYGVHFNNSKDPIYLRDEEELEIFKEKNPSDNYTISRFKGLGEMDAEQLWETTMNPENRVLEQITMEDCESLDNVFSVLMGTDVEPRKKFIINNSHLADLDI